MSAIFQSVVGLSGAQLQHAYEDHGVNIDVLQPFTPRSLAASKYRIQLTLFHLEKPNYLVTQRGQDFTVQSTSNPPRILTGLQLGNKRSNFTQPTVLGRPPASAPIVDAAPPTPLGLRTVYHARSEYGSEVAGVACNAILPLLCVVEPASYFIAGSGVRPPIGVHKIQAISLRTLRWDSCQRQDDAEDKHIQSYHCQNYTNLTEPNRHRLTKYTSSVSNHEVTDSVSANVLPPG
ncbi:hypothetical protein BDN72DRAFT_935593 [Pluteus cervinus]|uniref:Uncharacterized protein n=1 Tax=Pluteus cervinus TaxID=181527 RepID=A0ACD3BF95_9AGAR|nr:hypothetical protein BDN72DRAFT_935593 [Pluteus cervinus]